MFKSNSYTKTIENVEQINSLKLLNPENSDLRIKLENYTKSIANNLAVFSVFWKKNGGKNVWLLNPAWKNFHKDYWGDNLVVFAVVYSQQEINLALKEGYTSVINYSLIPSKENLSFEEALDLARKCSLCKESGHDRRRCELRNKVEKNSPDPWHDLEWNEHLDAMKIVAENPNGMTLEEIGATLGITRERVRQIEYQALEKLIVDGFGYDVSVMNSIKKKYESGKIPDTVMRDLLDCTQEDISTRLDGIVSHSIDGFFFRFLECEKCQETFVRLSGRQRYCEICRPEIRDRRKIS